jgi:hypothetical protein
MTLLKLRLATVYRRPSVLTIIMMAIMMMPVTAAFQTLTPT